MLEISKKVILKLKLTPREEDIFPLRKRDKLKTIEETILLTQMIKMAVCMKDQVFTCILQFTINYY